MSKNRTEPVLATYFHSKGRKLGLPISGNFELTARCNFNCPMCYVHMTEDEVRASGKELSTEQWIHFAEAAKNKGMIFALLTGGEPFVRKDFFEIYYAMREMGLIISINSNGSMLEGKILEKLLKEPPARINISLYGGCNETYQNMCGQPAFDRVLKNIITLKEHGVDAKVNLSITPYNCQDLEKIFEIVQTHNIQVRASSYMYPPVRLDKELEGYGNRLSPKESAKYNVIWDQLRLTKEEFLARAEAIEKLARVDLDECSIDMEEGVRCRAGSTSFWMTWDGKMRPCGMMTGPTAYPMEVGFDAAWKTIREETQKILLPSKCTSCPKKEICGVCAAVSAAETGKFHGFPQYMCERTDEIVKITREKYLEMKNKS